jgi:hypothetical protein
VPSDNYTEYNKVTGEIISVVSGPYKPVASASTNKIIKILSVPDQHRVDLSTLEIVDRYEFENPETNVSGLFTMQVPINTNIVWDNESYTVDDGLLEIEIDQPGSYKLLLTHPCYFTKELTIENS